jgi:glycogen synthase
MKVLMTVDAVGGVWTYAMELSRAIAAHGVSVVLAVLGPNPSPSQAAAATGVPGARLVPLGGRLEWMEEPWADVERNGERLLSLATECGADVVHLNGYVHASLPWRRPVVVVGHSCVTTWWRAVHREDPPAIWHEYRQRVIAGLGAADAVVAPTHAFIERLRHAYGVTTPDRVIPNGIDAPASTPGSGVPREPLVFACGRLWDEAKGMAVLDAAAHGLPWPIKLAGDLVGPDGRAFHPAAATALGALPHTEVAQWLQRASVFAHPSRYEPFGLAPLEAAQAGCALVLSDLPELRELWDGAAVFVRAADAAAWHDALRYTIVAAPERQALAAAARTRADELSARRMAERYHALYASLLHGAPRSKAVA